MFQLFYWAAAFLSVCSASAPVSSLDPSYNSAPPSAVRLLYQYPVGQWIENIAVRESGELLLTLLYSAHLDQLNPFEDNPNPRTVVSFPGYSSLSGISEIQPDVFAVAVGNTSSSSGPVAGSWSLWKTNFNHPLDPRPGAVQIVRLPDIQFPNGVTSLPSTRNPKNVLTSDVKTGKVWEVNTADGKHKVVVSNKLTAAVPDPVYGQSGTDGIRIKGRELYFANAGTGVFARIPIHQDGTPDGSPTVIARKNSSVSSLDDFAINGKYAYLANARGNSIERVPLDGSSNGEIIAGNLNSTEIAQPTSCAFGRTPRDRHILYVVTAGGLAIKVNGNTSMGAQVLAIDTTKLL